MKPFSYKENGYNFKLRKISRSETSLHIIKNSNTAGICSPRSPALFGRYVDTFKRRTSRK